MKKDLFYYIVYFNPSVRPGGGCPAYYIHKTFLFLNSKYNRPDRLLGIEELYIPLIKRQILQVNHPNIEYEEKGTVDELKIVGDSLGFFSYQDVIVRRNQKRTKIINEETYKTIYKFIKYKNWDQLLFLLKGIIDPVKEK